MFKSPVASEEGSDYLEGGVADHLYLCLDPQVTQGTTPLPDRGYTLTRYQDGQTPGPRAELVSVHHQLQSEGKHTQRYHDYTLRGSAGLWS